MAPGKVFAQPVEGGERFGVEAHTTKCGCNLELRLVIPGGQPQLLIDIVRLGEIHQSQA